MKPAVPPIALILPALTLVGVTFKSGAAYCGSLKMFVEVSSMRSVGADGLPVNRNFLCNPKCQRFSPGPVDRSSLSSTESSDGRCGERARVEPAGNRRIVEFRVAQLIGTERHRRAGRRAGESRAGRIGHRDRRRQVAAALDITDQRKLPAAERQIDECAGRMSATSSLVRTAVRTSTADVKRWAASSISPPRSRPRSNAFSIVPRVVAQIPGPRIRQLEEQTPARIAARPRWSRRDSRGSLRYPRRRCPDNAGTAAAFRHRAGRRLRRVDVARVPHLASEGRDIRRGGNQSSTARARSWRSTGGCTEAADPD